MKCFCNHYVCTHLDCPFHIVHAGYFDHHEVAECKCPKEVRYTDRTDPQTEREVE